MQANEVKGSIRHVGTAEMFEMGLIGAERIRREMATAHPTGLSRDKNNLRLVKRKLLICTDAERLIGREVRRGAVILYNDFILMGMKPKLAGLTVRNGVIDGVEIPYGEWVVPFDKFSRSEIRQAFDNGDTRIVLSEGEWADIRPSYRPDFWHNFIMGEVRQIDKWPARLEKTLTNLYGSNSNWHSRRFYRVDGYDENF